MDEYPPGYGKIAAIEKCDPNFLILRKFGWLHTRILLHHQDELASMEEELERIDNAQFLTDPVRVVSRRRDDALKSRRKELICEIEQKLRVYGKCFWRSPEPANIP